MNSKFKIGDLVEVRSKEEIFATLDEEGRLERLPFMPEMLKYCGRQMRVFKLVHKTCDSVHYREMRSMTNTVHLEDARCDGQGHGGCNAECLLFWKDAWLRKVSDKAASKTKGTTPPKQTERSCGGGCCSEQTILANAVRGTDPVTNEPLYSCQATRLLEATEILRWTDFRQYWKDYFSGNVTLERVISAAAFAVYEWSVKLPRIGRWVRKAYNKIQRFRGKHIDVYTTGTIPAGAPTPVVNLGLAPGDMVRVKSFDAIRETIDTNYRNRGMIWSAEMVPYCGKTFRVKNRVKQFIDEKTGKMLKPKTESVILDGAVCEGRYNSCRYLCPRSTYPYWREIWLEKIAASEDKTKASTPGA